VVPLADIEAVTMEVAGRIKGMPPFAVTLAKQAVNFAEDAMGLRAGIDHAFSLHQLAHAASAELNSGNAIMGATPATMKEAAKRDRAS
jgi:enoyl-CoA hydratase